MSRPNPLIPETMAQAVAIAKRVNASWPRTDALPAPLTAAPWVVLEPAAPAPTTGTAMSTPKGRTDAAQAVYQAAHNAWVTKDDPSSIAAAALRAAAAQMIKTDDLANTMDDVIRGSERHHQAGALCTIATELEGHHG